MNKLVAVFAVLLAVLSCACHAAEITNEKIIAILASGDVGDFGYNFIINEGRVKMERALNITATKWCPNVKNETAALKLIDALVTEGYRLIISTTADHGTAATKAAQKYPEVSFVQNGGTNPNLPNLSLLSFNGPDMYYAAGVFSGLQSKVGKVGFIHPGPPEASLGTINAFFAGVRYANPSANVYAVFTRAYLDPDRTAGACDILLNKEGVDMLAGQQDDFTLQTAAMARNYLAVGVNGYPLRNLFGEAVGMSVLRRWEVPLIAYGRLILANPTGVIKKDITASFASGITLLDAPSYLVSDEVWAKMQEVLVVFNASGNAKPYFCSPVVAELGVNSTDGCLLNRTKFTSELLQGIVNKGVYTVPLEDIPFPNGTRIGVIVLVALLFACTVGISIALYVLRRDAVILASSPVFMGLIIVGVAMVFAAAIAWVEDPNVHACTARIWLPSLGFTLCMGAMIIKNVRLWIIFDAEMKRVRIRNIKLLLWTGVLLALSILLLSLWTGLGKPHVEFQQGIAGLDKYQTRKLCATNSQGNHILYSIIALHASQLLVGCFVTFKIRVIDIEEFNESRPFGLCIYVVSLVMTIAGILIGTGGITNVQQIVIIVAFSLLIGSAAVLFLIFAPKFLTIFVKGERPMSRVMRGVAMTTSRSPQGSKNDSGTSSTASVSAVQTSTSNKTVVITDQV